MKSMKIIFCFFSVFALLVGCAIPVRAYDVQWGGSRESWFDIRCYLGVSTARENPGKLEDGSCGFSGGIGASFKIPKTKHFSLDLEFWDIRRSYDNENLPQGFFTDSYMSLDTLARLIGIRGFYPSNGSSRIYGTLGYGKYGNLISVEAYFVLLPFGSETIDCDDFSYSGYYIGGGLEFRGDHLLVSMDYRYFPIRGSFSKFNIEDVDITSSYFGISIGMYF